MRRRLMAAGGLAMAAAMLVAADAAPGEGIAAARHAAFHLSGSIFGAMKGAIDRGDDVKTLAGPSKSLAGWAHALPGAFPPGSDVEKSEALPAVWSDRAGFEKAAASYAAEADKLTTLATAGDKAGFAAQWGVVRGTCKTCHDTYKAPDRH